MNNWLSLKEASDITGKSIPALRQAIKRGKLSGRKISGPTGDMWMIDPITLGLDTIVPTDAPVNDNPDESPQFPEKTNSLNTATRNSEHVFDKTIELYERIIDEKSLLNNERGKHIDTLNILLGDFQQRIRLLEDDKENLESRFKMLPAPPETIREKWLDTQQKQEIFEKERKQLTDQISNMQNRINELTDRNLKLTELGSNTREEIEALGTKLEQAEQDIKTSENYTKKLEAENAEVQEKNINLLREIKTLREALNNSSETAEKLRDNMALITGEKEKLSQEKENIQKALQELWREKEELEKQIRLEQAKPWWRRLL